MEFSQKSFTFIWVGSGLPLSHNHSNFISHESRTYIHHFLFCLLFIAQGKNTSSEPPKKRLKNDSSPGKHSFVLNMGHYW